MTLQSTAKQSCEVLGDKPIRIEKANNRVVIIDPTEGVQRIIHDLLTYRHLTFLRGEEARERGTNIKVENLTCYQYVTDPDEIRPPQVIFPAGFRYRVIKELKTRGYTVDYKDKRPPVRDREFVYEPRWEALDGIEFRWRQRETLQAIAKYECGQIICPTGFGKSFMIAAMCKLWPKARIDVSTHSKDVIGMLYEDLRAQLPSVGLITGSKQIQPNSRVRCFSGKSVHKSDGKADVLFVDEVHEWATEDYLERAVRYYPRARKYGLSANKKGDRPDGACFELEGVFGPPLMVINYDDAVKHGCVVPVRVRWLNVVMDQNPAEGYTQDTAVQRWGLWRNDYRNAVIADAARQYSQQQVLIVVNRIEHACYLKKHLPEFSLCYSEAGLDAKTRERYVRERLIPKDMPEMTEARRHKMKKAFEKGNLRKVIATSVWNRGVNFRQLSVLIRADAQNTAISDTQIPGRLSRLSEDKPYGLLIDCRDQFDLRFKRRAEDRGRRYRAMGWTQYRDALPADGVYVPPQLF